MKRITLSSDAELKKLLDRLVVDIVEAGGYARLCKALSVIHPEYEREILQTPFFWNLTAHGLREACLMRLARVYDQDEKSLSLHTLLHALGRHAHFFASDSVLGRVSTAYAEEFQPDLHKIDQATLESDIKMVSSKDPLVNSLIIWRSNFGAHLSIAPILNSVIRGHKPLEENDIFALIDRALQIFNRYLFAFEGASHSSKIIGEDDYKVLFELLRIGLSKYESDNR